MKEVKYMWLVEAVVWKTITREHESNKSNRRHLTSCSAKDYHEDWRPKKNVFLAIFT